jgi:protein-disulfide isomerase
MEKQSKNFIAIVIFFALITVLVVFLFFIKYSIDNPFPQKNPPIKTVDDVVLPKQQEVSIAGNFWTGAANPKITIIEFSDFRCPYCKNSYSKIRQIGIKYKDSIKIVFKDYPLHDDSMDFSMAARCAGEQGLFWEMHDKLFVSQSNIKSSDLESMAISIGADKNKFSSCVSLEKYKKDILTDVQEGQKLNVKGTPTFFVNGYRVSGDLPMDQWEKIINLLLEQK